MSEYPVVIVENGTIRIVGVGLLKDGRYKLVKE